LSEEARYLRIARIYGAHGLAGRLKIFITSDFPPRFTPGKTVYIQDGDAIEPFTVGEFSIKKGREGLLWLEEIKDRDHGLLLRGKDIVMTREEAEQTRELLDEDSYYFYELIGCDVFREGSFFGTVKAVIEAGSGYILLIEGPGGREFHVPFVDGMVDTAELSRRRITIHPVEGLIEEQQE